MNILDNFNKIELMLNTALKEWSATIDALASGNQIFLLRKGGIREANRHFEMVHRRFLLYPTHFHEASRMLKSRFQHLTDSASSPVSDTVTFSTWAEVADVLRVNDVEPLEALSDFHIWTDEFIAKRIGWKPLHSADLILLKTYKLSEPIRIAVEPHHKGCKSWVDIAPSIDISASMPVMPDSEWEDRVQEIRLVLSETSMNPVPTA